MGWFRSFTKKIFAPIVEPINTYVIEPIKEVIIEPVVEVVTQTVETVVSFVEPVVEAISGKVADAVEVLSDGLRSFGEALADAAITYAPEIVFHAVAHWIDHKFDADSADFTQFAPVDGAVLKEHETISLQEDGWSAEETVMVRDVIALTQVAFADLDELEAHAQVSGLADTRLYDENGNFNDALVYEYESWHTGIETWVDARFDIIRVEEVTLAPFFEVNVTLFREYETGDYTIGIGGTDGTNDIVTNGLLTLTGGTPGSAAITEIIDDFFFGEGGYIEGGVDATVNLVGASLGGAEALQQYRATPELFDEVFVLVSAGIGGAAGTFYDRNVWDQQGDARITEINGDDPGTDFNDLVTSLGHVGAGQTYFIDEVINSSEAGLAPENEAINEFMDAHVNYNLWASVPGGDYPTLPVPEQDAFVFV